MTNRHLIGNLITLHTSSRLPIDVAGLDFSFKQSEFFNACKHFKRFPNNRCEMNGYRSNVRPFHDIGQWQINGHRPHEQTCQQKKATCKLQVAFENLFKFDSD